MMKFFVADIGGNDQVLNTAYVARIMPFADGIVITLMDGSEVETNTYDVPGFISNVLDDNVVTPQ